MAKNLCGVIAALGLASISTSALAQSIVWHISESSGPVSVRHGTLTHPATRDTTLSEGDVVETGSAGRAVLVHDRDFVTVNSNSRVAVPTAAEATGLVKIFQQFGNAIFKIEKLGIPHFGVNTPYLAAVVKGTTFSVTVDASGTSLQVVEGVVEVATTDGGARDLVRPGTVATISSRDRYTLALHGDTERTIVSPVKAAEAGRSVQGTHGGPDAATSTAELLPPAERLDEKVISRPVDLSALTGGVLTGTTANISTVVLSEVRQPSLNQASGKASLQPVAAFTAPPVASAPASTPTAQTLAPAVTPPAVDLTVSPPPVAALVVPLPVLSTPAPTPAAAVDLTVSMPPVSPPAAAPVPAVLTPAPAPAPTQAVALSPPPVAASVTVLPVVPTPASAPAPTLAVAVSAPPAGAPVVPLPPVSTNVTVPPPAVTPVPVVNVPTPSPPTNLPPGLIKNGKAAGLNGGLPPGIAKKQTLP